MTFEIRCPHCGSEKVIETSVKRGEWECENCSFLTDSDDLDFVEFEALME